MADLVGGGEDDFGAGADRRYERRESRTHLIDDGLGRHLRRRQLVCAGDRVDHRIGNWAAAAVPNCRRQFGGARLDDPGGGGNPYSKPAKSDALPPPSRMVSGVWVE